MEYSFSNLPDLEKVIKAGVMPLRPIQFQLPQLTEQENKRLEQQLNSYIKACGCDTGSYFTLGGLLVTTVLFLTDKLHWSWSGGGYATLVVLSFAFTGKTIGMLVARILFFKTLRQVLYTMQPECFVADEVAAHP